MPQVRVVQRAQGREAGEQFGMLDLVDLLWLCEAFQYMGAQIPKCYAFRQEMPHEFKGGMRQQRLAAVARCKEAGHSIDRRPEVVIVSMLHGTCMDRHMHLDGGLWRPGFSLKGYLGGQHSLYRLRRRGERRAKGIPNSLEDMAVGTGDGLTHDGIMASKGGAHDLRMRFSHPGAAFDVREEEVDRSSWEGHNGSNIRCVECLRMQ